MRLGQAFRGRSGPCQGIGARWTATTNRLAEPAALANAAASGRQGSSTAWAICKLRNGSRCAGSVRVPRVGAVPRKSLSRGLSGAEPVVERTAGLTGQRDRRRVPERLTARSVQRQVAPAGFAWGRAGLRARYVPRHACRLLTSPQARRNRQTRATLAPN